MTLNLPQKRLYNETPAVCKPPNTHHHHHHHVPEGLGVLSRSLIFYSLAVTLRTTMFNIQKILHADYIAFMCFVWLSEKTEIFLTYTASTDWFL